MTLIAVHGATGTQGAPVVRRLVAAGHRVRAISRKPRALPPGAEPVAADLTDAAALASAYQGAQAVVVQLPLVFDGTAITQAESILSALRKARVPRAVFSAGGPAPESATGVPFLDALALLRTQLPDVVATASMVAPAAGYLENFAAPWSAPLIAAGEAVYPLPAGLPMPWVAVDDLAAVITELVTTSAPPAALRVAGPAELTGPQVAAELTAALGRPVRWRTITPAEYRRMLQPHLGDAVAAGIAAAYESPAPSTPDSAAVRIGPTTLRQWARANERLRL